MARWILIHGWAVGDGGEKGLGPLADALRARGQEVLMPSYGRVISPWSTSKQSTKFAQNVSTAIQPGDIVVGHSNGARVARELSFYAPLIRTMVWLNPALETDALPARSVKRCLVVHGTRDWVVMIARWLPGSIWGAMGRLGYAPPPGWPWEADKRMTCLEYVGDHSDFDVNPAHWAEELCEFAGVA